MYVWLLYILWFWYVFFFNFFGWWSWKLRWHNLKMTICKNRILVKCEYGKQTESQKKRKLRRISTSKQAALACWSFFLPFFIFSKKMITKEINMGASVFISANGYMRACACMFARACARAERRFRRNCAYFATLCCNSCTHCVKTRQLDLCGHKYQGHYKDRQDLFVPRQ